MGLIADLFEPGTVLQNTVKVASELAQQSSEAMCLAKQAICHGELWILRCRGFVGEATDGSYHSGCSWTQRQIRTGALLFGV